MKILRIFWPFDWVSWKGVEKSISTGFWVIALLFGGIMWIMNDAGLQPTENLNEYSLKVAACLFMWVFNLAVILGYTLYLFERIDSLYFDRKQAEEK